MKAIVAVLMISLIGCAHSRKTNHLDDSRYLTREEFVKSVNNIDKAITSHFNRLASQVEENTKIIQMREDMCPCK